MDQKDFNRGLDNYLGKVTKKEGSSIDFSDVFKFGRKQRNFKDVEFKFIPNFLNGKMMPLNPKRKNIICNWLSL